MKRNFSIGVKQILWYTTALVGSKPEHASAPAHSTLNRKSLLVALLVSSSCAVNAQERKVDPTWLHRYVPSLADTAADLSSPTCHYKGIFGEGDAESHSLPSVARFGEAAVGSQGTCAATQYDRQEEIYFVLEGSGGLQYGNRTYPIRKNDFTYLPPGVKHSISNNSDDTLVVLVMGFKIRPSVSVDQPSAEPKIVNLGDVKEETVSGHPSSVLYKLLLGPKSGKRDAIDDANVVVSFFWMDFAPGGTNFPHHHETAEEIYLVVDGEGEMVAGGGMDGVEGRHPAKAGDAYYFRQNCTVGFYNQNKPGAKAHILAVRSWVPLPKDED
jgi:mannose-6-phosphate isomerase-like protein (cupin superfamily)